MNEPVCIVGAGPSGLTAAIHLRLHGVPVRVLEMAADVGRRLSGDLQGLENWSTDEEVPEFLARLGIATNFICRPVHGGTVHAPGLAPCHSSSERPIFYLVRRGSMAGTLDVGLKEQALALGATIEFNRRFDPAEVDAGGPVIVATGPTRADALALGMTFDTPMADTAIVIFDDALAPRGYAYLLISGGLGTLSTVLFRDFHGARTFFERTLQRFRDDLGVAPISGERFASFGNFFLRDSQRVGNRLYVGEAAGFQDCLWGFGMRHAMLSGWLAARSIVEGLDYDLLWRREIRPLLETSLVNRFIQDNSGSLLYRYVSRRLQRDPTAFLRSQYAGSMLKRLLLPLAIRSFDRRRPADQQLVKLVQKGG